MLPSHFKIKTLVKCRIYSTPRLEGIIPPWCYKCCSVMKISDSSLVLLKEQQNKLLFRRTNVHRDSGIDSCGSSNSPLVYRRKQQSDRHLFFPRILRGNWWRLGLCGSVRGMPGVNAKECIHCICSYRIKKYCWHWKHALTERKIYTVHVGHNCHKFVYFWMWQYNTLKKL